MTTGNESNELQKLDTAMDLLSRAEAKVSDIFKGLEEVIEKTRQDLLILAEEKIKLNEEKENLQIKAEQQQKQISGLNREQMELLKEYESVKEELEKFTKVATSIGTFNLEDMRATLAIYGKLIEEVFASQPHFKILYILHGDIHSMNLEQLKGAMGLGGVIVLRAVHELAKVNLIEFDEETHNVRLLQRFFPKREN